MADKEITPKDPEATEASAEDDNEKGADAKAAGKKASRKVGRQYSSSDRNLKDNVVRVRW